MPSFERMADGQVLPAAKINELQVGIETNETNIGALQSTVTGKSDVGHKHVAADLNTSNSPSATTFLRGDNQWVVPTNTTYSVISQAEAEAGTATTSRVVSAARLRDTILFHAPVKTTDLATKSDINHTHDDRYYTESEVDAYLAAKAEASHLHDDRYYTETEVDNALALKANSVHDHDDRYYTETEINSNTYRAAASLSGGPTYISVSPISSGGMMYPRVVSAGSGGDFGTANNAARGDHLHDGRYPLISTVDSALATKATHTYVQSRGTNLVTNGTGLLRDNTNFSSFVFDPVNANNGMGGFLIESNQVTIFSDEFIPVDPSRTYQLSMYAKAAPASAGTTSYMGIAAFDYDENSISAINTYRYPASDTTLSASLAPGATTVSLSSVSGWYTGTTASAKYISIYGYQNSSGYTYPNYTYTRIVLPFSSVNTSNNTVTLSSPFPSTWGTIPAGRAVSNGRAGASWKYITGNNVTLTDSYQYYSGQIGGIDTSGENVSTMFPPGIASVKLLFLPNRSATPTNVHKQYYADLIFTDATQKTLGVELAGRGSAITFARSDHDHYGKYASHISSIDIVDSTKTTTTELTNAWIHASMPVTLGGASDLWFYTFTGSAILSRSSNVGGVLLVLALRETTSNAAIKWVEASATTSTVDSVAVPNRIAGSGSGAFIAPADGKITASVRYRGVSSAATTGCRQANMNVMFWKFV